MPMDPRIVRSADRRRQTLEEGETTIQKTNSIPCHIFSGDKTHLIRAIFLPIHQFYKLPRPCRINTPISAWNTTPRKSRVLVNSKYSAARHRPTDPFFHTSDWPNWSLLALFTVSHARAVARSHQVWLWTHRIFVSRLLLDFTVYHKLSTKLAVSACVWGERRDR